jgi:ribosome biogenesis GTPase
MEQVIAANVDLLLCIAGADRTNFRRTVIDRYIVAALLGNVTPVVILNKMDTVEGEIDELLREEMAIYEELGYHTIFTSTVTGEGIDELCSVIAGKTSVLVGQSGVGKSTITNVILGREERRTGEVREKDRRGMHTTIGSAMLPLPDGGYLIDTPGLREFGIWDLEPEELDGYFVEFLDYLQKCKFLPCTHTHEPGCAVIAAVEAGQIDPGRYASYLNIFESLKGRSRH